MLFVTQVDLFCEKRRKTREDRSLSPKNFAHNLLLFFRPNHHHHSPLVTKGGAECLTSTTFFSVTHNTGLYRTGARKAESSSTSTSGLLFTHTTFTILIPFSHNLVICIHLIVTLHIVQSFYQPPTILSSFKMRSNSMHCLVCFTIR